MQIKNHLKSEREGFSLVEIIIVIAIMAILVGVIALAVIPNIGRSHESKDIQELDNIAASLNIAIANNQVASGGSFILGEKTGLHDYEEKIYDAVETELGDLSQVKMESGAAQGGKIHVSWTGTDPTAAQITVEVVDGSNNTLACEYTAGGSDDPVDADGKRLLKVGKN